MVKDLVARRMTVRPSQGLQNILRPVRMKDTPLRIACIYKYIHLYTYQDGHAGSLKGAKRPVIQTHPAPRPWGSNDVSWIAMQPDMRTAERSVGAQSHGPATI